MRGLRTLGALAGFMIAVAGGSLPANAQDPEIFLVSDPLLTDNRLHFPVLISNERGYRIRCTSQSSEEAVIRGLGFLTVPSQIVAPTDPRVDAASPADNPLLCPRADDYPIKIFAANTETGLTHFLQFVEGFGSDMVTDRIYTLGCAGLVDALGLDLATAIEADPRQFFTGRIHEIACLSGEPPVTGPPTSVAAWCMKGDLSATEEATVRALLNATPVGDAALGNATGCAAANGFLSQLTTLNLSGAGVASTAPLAQLTQMVNLSLADGEITEVGPLAALTSLTSLDLSGNQITSLSGLNPLTQLTALDFSGNQISDLRPLSAMVLMQSLNLGSNKLSDLEPLEFMLELRSIKLSDNALTGDELGPLTGLGALELVDLSDNQITIFDHLSGFPSHVQIDISGNPDVAGQERDFLQHCVLSGTDATPSGHTIRQMLEAVGSDNCAAGQAALLAASTLDLSARGLSDLTPLAPLTHLQQLNLAGNAISDIGPLSSLTGIRTLDLSDNTIIDITPLAPLIEINTLNAANNPVSVGTYLSACIMRNQPDVLTGAQLAEVAALSDAVGGGNCQRTNSQLRITTSLILIDKGLSSLDYFPVLESVKALNLSNNPITDVAALGTLPQLLHMTMQFTDIGTGASLRHLRLLTSLNVSRNSIDSLSFLQSIPNLRSLNIGNTLVRNMRALLNAPSLDSVNMSGLDPTYFNIRDYCVVHRYSPSILGNQRNTVSAILAAAGVANIDITDCVAVEVWAHNIQVLNLNRKSLSNIAPIRFFKDLTELYLAGNFISDPLPIRGLRTLRRLSMADNMLRNIPRTRSPGLERFYLGGNRINALNGLSEYPNLTHLDLKGNELTDALAILPLANLDYLNMMENSLVNLLQAIGLAQKGAFLKGNPLCANPAVHNLPHLSIVKAACLKEPQLFILNGNAIISNIINNNLITNRNIIIIPGGN